MKKKTAIAQKVYPQKLDKKIEEISLTSLTAQIAKTLRTAHPFGNLAIQSSSFKTKNLFE